MNRFSKIVNVIVVLSLLLSSLASCNKKDDRTNNSALEAYNALESNIDKLFYFPGDKHPVSDKIALLKSDTFGMFVGAHAFSSNSSIETDFELSLNRVLANGEDVLSKMNTDSLNLKGSKIVTPQHGANIELSTFLAGISLEADIITDDNAIMLDCPAVFKKPIYVSNEAVPEVGLEALKYAFEGELSAIFDSLSSAFLWARENLTESDLRYIFGLFRECLPLNRISSEAVTISEHKGEFVDSNVTAECITLSLDSNGLDKFLTNVNNTVLLTMPLK